MGGNAPVIAKRMAAVSDKSVFAIFSQRKPLHVHSEAVHVHGKAMRPSCTCT